MRLVVADKLLRNTVYNTLRAPYITKRDVEEAPTVDAVTVVRCADCKFWAACESDENDCNCYGVCEQINRLTMYDCFCADGEVKEDD